MQESTLRLGLIPGIAGEALEQDWDGTLTALAALGYSGIEMASGTLEKSGLSAERCRASLAEHGIEAMSWFAGWGDFDKNIDEHIAKAKALGCDYMVWGWAPANDKDQMQEVLPVMAKASRMVGAAGMRLLYHNHDHEFLARHGDTIAYDWLMEQFSAEQLQCELDIGWVAYGGQDVVATIEKHAGRCPMLHMRDIEDPDTRAAFIEVGEGRLDLPAILRAGLDQGASRWAIIEHTKQLKREPLEGLRIAAENLKRTGLVG